MNADRLADLHVPSRKLNTGNGFGGECHLDANMVRTALGALPLDELDLLIIENVGNLVCRGEFHVGADARIMVCSVLPHLDFDIERLEANIAQINPAATTMRVSARSGDGVDVFRRWLVDV
ncbi:MAG TPA: hydrogenase accessory protein HypB, partial [Solirubrobacteraceae bacterium]